MLKKLAEFLLNITSYFFPPEEKAVPLLQEDYFLMVEQARQEWETARDRFDQISEPDLIDHAIYNLVAAERRYIYLLRQVREEGLNIHSAIDQGGG